ncbi:hypothetical protein Nepgr_003655 [Nepenthes gracilis]|uniref:Uncharacterized protein n=1 Tax=Nepenthes gracilis TaxID=150966 RepID=A0AAD3XE87_NEPGR|nr:hypothetical protein Nepgr_003655 [Nepenthes gracilis]
MRETPVFTVPPFLPAQGACAKLKSEDFYFGREADSEFPLKTESPQAIEAKGAVAFDSSVKGVVEMKIDYDPGFLHSNPQCKFYNPFDSDDDPSNTCRPKSEKEFIKDNFSGFDLKAFEKDADTLPFRMRNGGFPWDETILCHSTAVNNEINADANGDDNMLGKETEFCTDKNVMQCEYPELLVCYKDSSYLSVKDICIDDRVPSQDKIWAKSVEGNSKNLSAILYHITHKNGDLDMGIENHELPILKGLKSLMDCDCQRDDANQCCNEGSAKMDGLSHKVLGKKYSSNQCETDDSVKIYEAKHDLSEKESVPDSCCTAADREADGFVCDVGDGDSSMGSSPENDASISCESHLMSKDELNHVVAVKEGNDLSKNCSAGNVLLAQKLDSEELLLKPSIFDSRYAKINSAQSPNEGATLHPSSELFESQELADSSNANGTLSCNSNVESGSITLDFNSSASEKEEEMTHNIYCEKPAETEIMSGHVEGISGKMKDSIIDQQVHGEMDLSAGIPPPSLINYSGPLAFSGNISLRSESSAGSTRSFAFPILQTEWNISPVRMAKADQRHFRKHRRWVQALICCRF